MTADIADIAADRPAAAPLAGPPADQSRGTNQSGVKLYNERLILSLIRRHRSLSKVEIARQTGLSVQTISGIVNRLEQDGRLLRRDPQRGRVGQPAVPFVLNPDGAFSIGLKIGRRSCDLVLIDFVGKVRHRLHRTHAYPLPGDLVQFVEAGLGSLVGGLSAKKADRISGLGIAIPFELWNWQSEVGAPSEVMKQWRSFDIRAAVAAVCPWSVDLCNDATAACAAELFFGEGWRQEDFIYFFIGSFIGGGVVLDGSLYSGRTGNAGAVGSMPVTAPDGRGGSGTQQLIRGASIYVLERKLIAAGKDPSSIWRSPDTWAEFGPELEAWIGEVAGQLAQAIVSATSVIDFEAAVIDGAFPAEVRARIVARTAATIEGFDRQGLSPVAIREGTIGSDARAIGGGALPLLADFARDREVLFKEAAGSDRG
jgi:predicted NBD/HSP70 family sugar kinase